MLISDLRNNGFAILDHNFLCKPRNVNNMDKYLDNLNIANIRYMDHVIMNRLYAVPLDTMTRLFNANIDKCAWF